MTTVQLSHCKKGKEEYRGTGLTAALLLLRILRLADIHHLAALTQRVLRRVPLDSLAGDDAVNFYI